MGISEHNGVTCFYSTIKMFGTKLDVFAYAVDGILVDTGSSRFEREFVDFFRLQQINRAVLTHHHEDHSGNAAWLEKQGVPVYIHPAAIPVCLEPARLPLYRRIGWCNRERFSPLPVPDIIEGNSKTWQVIETPGHTPDHVAIYGWELGVLFTGDLFISPRIRLAMRDESISGTIRSLRLLLTKDFHTLYCGHAGVVENGRVMLRLKLEYLENLTGEVLELHRRGMSIREINRRIYSRNSLMAYLSVNEWSSVNVVRSIIRGR